MDKDMVNIILKDLGSMEKLEYFSDSNEINKNFDNSNINIYGMSKIFPGCIWNTNYEETKNDRLSFDEIKEIGNKFEKLGIKLLIIFDRDDIKREELKDEYCRTLLKILNNGEHLVYVKSRLLRHVIKYKYKKMKLLDSQRNVKQYDIIILSNNITDTYKISYSYMYDIKKYSYEELENIVREELNSPWLI